METLGRRIAALRWERELKQDELAAMLDVSPQAVSKWENDQTCPDISALPKLSEILGVTVDELLSGKNAEAQPTVKILPPAERKDIKDMILRVIVDSSDGDKVRINLPLILVQVALETGVKLPGLEFSGNNALKDVDLHQVMTLVHQGVVGNLMEVESASGDTVRIFVE